MPASELPSTAVPNEMLPPEPTHKRQLREIVDIAKEDNTMLRYLLFWQKEWRAMKDGRWAFIVLSVPLLIVSCGLTYWFVFEWIAGQQIAALNIKLDGLNSKVAVLGDELEDTKRDRDKYQTEFLNDENTMAPVREIANKQYAEADPSKRLDLLLQKMDSFQNDIDTKITNVGNPVNQAIATATAEVTIKWKEDPKSTDGNIESVGFGLQTSPLLVAAAPAAGFSMRNMGTNSQSETIECALLRKSPYVGRPVSSLCDAQYLEIGFSLPNVIVLGGEVTWTINGNVVLTFEVPPQTAQQGQIFIMDLSNGLKPISTASR